MAKNKTINLLPQEEFDASVMGRTLHWAMGTFRIIVILTEMIVMAAFLSRFWLDAENSNLSDSIKIASSQIQVQSKFEGEFRDLQRKLNVFKLVNEGVKNSSRIDLISNRTPLEIILTSVNVQGNSSQVKGIASSEVNVAQFLSNLINDTGVKKAELTSLASSQETNSQTLFTINITF